MDMEAKIVVGSVALKERPLFGSVKTWVFESLEQAIEALESGGSVIRRRLTQLECVVEKHLVVQGRTPGLDQSTRIGAKTNSELLAILQQMECELAWREMYPLLAQARQQSEVEARTTLEFAIAVGESAFPSDPRVLAREGDWNKLLATLADCYEALIECLEQSHEANVEPDPVEPPLPPLGDPDRKTERRRRFAQRGYRLPQNRSSITAMIEEYRKRHRQLLAFAEVLRR
jgi:hypothetical protein